MDDGDLPPVPAFEEVLPDWSSVVVLPAPAPPLEYFKTRKRREIVAARDAAAVAGAPTPFGRVDTTERSRLLMTGAVQMATLAKGANTAFSIDWTMEDNSVVTLDADGMLAVGLAVGVHTSTLFDRARALQAAVAAATTREAVEAVTW